MSRFGMWSTILSVAFAAVVSVGYVADQATAQAPAAPSVQAITVYRVTAGDYIVTNDRQIVPFSTQPIPPTPEPPTPPAPVSDLSRAIVSEINKITASDSRHAAATKLGAAYDALGGGTIPQAKAVEVANALMAMVLTSAEQKSMAGVTGVVNAALAKCITDASVAETFKEAGVACVSTVPASAPAIAQMQSDLAASDQDELKALGERYGIDWAAFMQMLMQFMTVILPIILQFFKAAAVVGQFVLLA